MSKLFCPKWYRCFDDNDSSSPQRQPTALWLGRLVVTFWQSDPSWIPVMLCDSQRAVELARNPIHHNAMKHIEVRYHFIQERVTHVKLRLEKVSTGVFKRISLDHWETWWAWSILRNSHVRAETIGFRIWEYSRFLYTCKFWFVFWIRPLWGSVKFSQ